MDLRSQLPRLQAIFEEALTYPEGTDRESFLDHACGDDSELRAGVARVLEGFQRASVVPESMPRFGPYQALRLIGRGGMGSVYLAERADGQFEMQVAVKVVSGCFLSSVLEDHFRRERQILAGLNHPNIARLLDGGVENGAPFLVMEYVDGLRLDEYCRQRNHTVRESIALLCTVCHAVEYAHAAHVIHRDLKPSNILVTADGVVKLLDFGSSKMLDSSTAPGHTVLRGYTPDYASPEQMEGRATGVATDIYSLGILLSKLCTDDRAAAVAARATHRDPARRHASVGLFRKDLEEILSGSRLTRHLRWSLAAAAAAILCLIAVWNLPKGGVAANDDLYVRLSPPGARWRDASVSANGKWLAYASDQQQPGNYDIWLRGMDETGIGRRLTSGVERDIETSVSPDGQYVAFHSNRSPPGIYRVEAATGRTELLAVDGRMPRYSPDGRWIAYSGLPRLAADAPAASPRHFVKIMPASGGPSVDVSQGLLSSGLPVWSPDGSELWFIAYDERSTQDFWRVHVGQSIGARSLRRKGDPHELKTMECAVQASGTIWSLLLESEESRSISQTPQPAGVLLEDPLPLGFEGKIRDCSASREGALVIEGVESRTVVSIQPLDPSGAKQGESTILSLQPPATYAPSLSWDGRWMAYAAADRTTWLNDLQTGKSSQYKGAPVAELALSGDGLILWSRETQGVLAQKRRDAGVLHRVDHPFSGNVVWGTNHDGRMALVYGRFSNPRAVTLIDAEMDRSTRILSHPLWNLYEANFSPDERWIVFEADTLEGALVFVAPFHGSKPIPVEQWILIGKGDDPKWSADGKSVFVLSQADGYSCVWRIPVDAATKVPTGVPEGFVHWHGLQSPQFLGPGVFRIAASQDKLAFVLGERDEVVWKRKRAASGT